MLIVSCLSASLCGIPFKPQTLTLNYQLLWVGCSSLTQKMADDMGLELRLSHSAGYRKFWFIRSKTLKKRR